MLRSIALAARLPEHARVRKLIILLEAENKFNTCRQIS